MPRRDAPNCFSSVDVFPLLRVGYFEKNLKSFVLSPTLLTRVLKCALTTIFRFDRQYYWAYTKEKSPRLLNFLTEYLGCGTWCIVMSIPIILFLSYRMKVKKNLLFIRLQYYKYTKLYYCNNIKQFYIE